jgi:hypothetical protein
MQTQLFAVSGGASLTLTSLRLTRGSNVQGGAIDNEGTLNVSGSTFVSNNTPYAYGSAIYNAGTLHVSGSTFALNGTMYGTGGAIYNRGTLNVDTSTFSGNTTWQGGAIANFYGSAVVDSSTFLRNWAEEGAGIWTVGNYESNELIVSNSIFIQNQGVTDGSAISINSTPTTVRNSTFSGNVGRSTVYVGTPAPTTLLNNTFAGNNPSSATISANHSTLTEGGNIFDTNWNSCSVGSIVDLGYNVDPTGGCTGNLSGTGDVSGDPTLGTLANNGGPTQTIALLSGSPAIDHIPTSYTYVDANSNNVPLCPSTDQRGTPRPQGNATFCDAGAFESDLPPTPPDSTSPVITPNISGTLGNNGWYTSDVTITWSVTDAESDIASSNGCDSTTITSDTTGTTLTCSATSAGGTNTQSVTIMRDATAPTLSPSISPNPVLLNGTATANPNASDATSGIAGSNCDSVDTSNAGAHTVNCSATDNAGNTANAPAGYTVSYQFSGFTRPVDGSVLNVAKAGQTIPLKWRLTDANGDPVTNLSSVSATAVGLQCAAGTSADQVSEYASGASGLQNLGDGYYQFNWATPKSYANSCKTLRLNLSEGSSSNPIYHTADFSFTK